MEIRYLTKQESNRLQQEEFLKLSPVERIYAFLDLSYRLKNFPSKPSKNVDPTSFLIEIIDE